MQAMKVHNGTLRLDCSICGGASSPVDRCCTRCITIALMDAPTVSRVLLRRGNDRIVQGDAVILLKELAAYLTSMAALEGRRKLPCRNCPRSPQAVYQLALATFPLPPQTLPSPKGHRDCIGCVTSVDENLRRARQLNAAVASRAAFVCQARR